MAQGRIRRKPKRKGGDSESLIEGGAGGSAHAPEQEQSAASAGHSAFYSAGPLLTLGGPALSRVGPTVQKAPEAEQAPAQTPPVEAVPPAPTMAAPTPAESATARTPAAGWIVEDDAPTVGPGRMSKSAFLAQAKAAVCATAEDALHGTLWSALGCPWIERWFTYYSDRSGAQVEAALHRYAPETRAATSAYEYIPLLCARVRQGIRTWLETGQAEGVGGAVPGGPPDSGLVSGAMNAASDMLSGVGNLFMKGEEGGASGSANPQAIQGQLGPGRPLDSGVGSRIGAALGQDLSQVRVHTDGRAEALSEDLNARAFTVGEHVAFGAGEYQPGTPVGDALIAHELAHVAQQSGSGAAVAPMQEGGNTYNALEADADRSAVGAVLSLWGKAKAGLGNIAQNALPRLRSGLRLQRCSEKSKQPAAALGPVPNYDSFSYPDGRMKDGEATLSMMKNSEQLEQVYQDADAGNPRAKRFVQEMEDTFSATGKNIAEQASSPDCLIPAYRELKGTIGGNGCIPDWSYLGFLRKDKPGGQRLRRVIGEAYENRAHELGIRNEIILNGLNLLFAGMVIKGTMTTVPPETKALGKETKSLIGETESLTGEVKAGAGGTKVVTEEAKAATGGAKGGTGATKPPDAAKLVNESTGERYYVKDFTNPKFYAWAQVEDGFLQIDLRAELAGGARSTVLSGSEQFGKIMDHFKGQVKGIKGNWSYGTNLAEFNKLTGGGMPANEAALKTWTGEQVSKSGFTRVRVDSLEGKPGAYTKVKVTFTPE